GGGPGLGCRQRASQALGRASPPPAARRSADVGAAAAPRDELLSVGAHRVGGRLRDRRRRPGARGPPPAGAPGGSGRLFPNACSGPLPERRGGRSRGRGRRRGRRNPPRGRLPAASPIIATGTVAESTGAPPRGPGD